jgi:glycosyltransferase involved in cell wall biosynthesis
MRPEVSVIVSTHNPNIATLDRILNAIVAQTLNQTRWELVIVDNASANSTEIDGMPWRLGNRRLIREERLGLTYGRLAGIRQSRAEILLFVDDDNVLAPDYLEIAVKTFSDIDDLGVAGGVVEPEWCDGEPETWVSEFFYALALRNYGSSVLIANKTSHPNSYPPFSPIGAGMIARRSALADWIAGVERGSLVDRRGTDLTSCGDCDMALTALDSGWSVGYFPNLKLTHLLPGHRLRFDYLGRLCRGTATSWVQVLSKHDICPWRPVPPWTVPLRKAKAYLQNRAWAGCAEYVRWQAACGQFEGRAALYRRGRCTK